MKLYCDKTRARYAAKRELAKGDVNLEPNEGEHFELVEQDGKFGWRPISAQAADAVVAAAVVAPASKPRKAPRSARAQALHDHDVDGLTADVMAAVDETIATGKIPDRIFAEALPEPAAELPTAFVPDVKAGEIASAEYGMLLTRERAGEAAKAAGVSDPVITQTARGLWVWRTPALNQVWRESQKPPKQPVTLSAAAAPKASKAKVTNGRRGGSKLDIAEALLRRPEGATPEEVAAQVDGWDARSAKIRIGTCLKLTRKLAIVCEVEEGRGRVYRIAA